jgi:hypothetical protein
MVRHLLRLLDRTTVGEIDRDARCAEAVVADLRLHSPPSPAAALLHSSLVATCDDLPLGLAALKFWKRNKFHGGNALRRRINSTHVPIEKKESICWLENLQESTELLNDPGRCVHIGGIEGTDEQCVGVNVFCVHEPQHAGHDPSFSYNIWCAKFYLRHTAK